MVGIALLAGCVTNGKEAVAPKPYVGHPWYATILMDSRFTDAQAGKVLLGFDAWARGLGGKNVDLHYGRVLHSNAVSASAPTGWIYVVYVESNYELLEKHYCAPGDSTRTRACWHPDRRHIYLVSDNDGQLSALASHELGHAMGLEHVPSGPAAMGETTDKMSFPTSKDFEAFCRINGCSL